MYMNKGLITQKRKCFDVRLIAKNAFCLFDVLLYFHVNSYGHMGALSFEKYVFSNKPNKQKFFFAVKRNSCQVYVEEFSLMCLCDEAFYCVQAPTGRFFSKKARDNALTNLEFN